MVFYGSGSQCWYFSHDPSSLFHYSVLVDFSVSMMMHLRSCEPFCEPNINCFLYYGVREPIMQTEHKLFLDKGLRLNLGQRFARSGGCP